eukprot:2174010-Ditylum_brightwellii.AAC.1
MLRKVAIPDAGEIPSKGKVIMQASKGIPVLASLLKLSTKSKDEQLMQTWHLTMQDMSSNAMEIKIIKQKHQM